MLVLKVLFFLFLIIIYPLIYCLVLIAFILNEVGKGYDYCLKYCEKEFDKEII